MAQRQSQQTNNAEGTRGGLNEGIDSVEHNYIFIFGCVPKSVVSQNSDLTRQFFDHMNNNKNPLTGEIMFPHSMLLHQLKGEVTNSCSKRLIVRAPIKL